MAAVPPEPKRRRKASWSMRIVRAVLGVVVAFVVIVIIVGGGMAVAYASLGPEGAFKAGSYDITGAWIAVWLGVNVVAALLGGVVCKFIGRSMTPAYALAVIVLLLGAASLVQGLTKPDPGPREGDITMQAAMNDAKQPTWVLIANPIIGAVGVLIGGAIVPAGTRPGVPLGE